MKVEYVEETSVRKSLAFEIEAEVVEKEIEARARDYARKVPERPQGGPPPRPSGIHSREGGMSMRRPTEDAESRAGGGPEPWSGGPRL